VHPACPKPPSPTKLSAQEKLADDFDSAVFAVLRGQEECGSTNHFFQAEKLTHFDFAKTASRQEAL
jgi:hypothetical protein